MCLMQQHTHFCLAAAIAHINKPSHWHNITCLCCSAFYSFALYPFSTTKRQHATKAISKRCKEGSQIAEGCTYRYQETPPKAQAVVLNVHLQGAEAGAPRHWCQLKSNVNHELVRERPV